MTSDATTDEHEAKRARRAARINAVKRFGRIALLVLGIGAVIALVYDAGPGTVWATLVSAGVWVPLILLCEIGFVGMDVVSLRLMYGERGARIPASAWLRSALMAYGIMILLPAGRAGGEVMRAATLSRFIGGPRAAAGATLLQAVTLWGNTLISIPCYVAVAYVSGAGSALAWLVGMNGVLTAILGSVVLFGARVSKVGGWLGRRLKALASHGANFDESLREMPTMPVVPIGAALVGRLFQTAQYAVLLVAVGGSLTIASGFVSQAIHLVGAGLGDMIPNAAGVTEFVYREFAASLDFEDARARAISIALLHRVCQYSLAGASLAIGALWRPSRGDSTAVAPAISPSSSEGSA